VSYINKVPTAVTASAIPTYDVASVQVLKGPQGTLFGRNTTAGVLLVTTQRPTYELGASAEATFGDYDWKEYVGVVNVPLVKDFSAARRGPKHTARRIYRCHQSARRDPEHAASRQLPNFVAA
jgi:iron complex outermembrane receptor protein